MMRLLARSLSHVSGGTARWFSSIKTTTSLFPVEISIATERYLWEDLGFSVSNDNVIHLKEMKLRLVDGGGEVLGWSFNDNNKLREALAGGTSFISHVAGVPLIDSDNNCNIARNVEHQNGVYEIDHIVLQTENYNFTKSILTACGMELKREILNEKKNLRQSFYRPSKTIIEVLSSIDSNSTVEDPSSTTCKIWGITFSCHDIDQTHKLLSSYTKPPHKALQPGRRMTVLNTSLLNIPLRIAFMSPHIPSS